MDSKADETARLSSALLRNEK